MSNWDSSFQLSVLQNDGRPLIERPINISELLENQGRMDVGNGVRVYLEEADDDDYDEDAGGFYDGEQSGHETSAAAAAGGGYLEGVHAPYGFGEVNEWYEAIQSMEADQHHHSPHHGQPKASEAAAASSGVYANQGGPALAAGKPPLPGSAAAASSGYRDKNSVWADQAPPPPPVTHTFKKLQAISYMPEVRGKKFAPVPVMKHSLTVAPGDSHHMLLFGGTNGRSDESELYEFALGSTTWRRVEGKMSVPLGMHSHAAVAYNNRFLVIGGVGIGGKPTDPSRLLEVAQQKRFKQLFPHGSSPAPRQHSLLDLTVHHRAAPVPRGLHSLMFELELTTGRWRAVQTSFEHPVACHTALAHGHSVYVFGGVTENMCVTNALLQIDQTTFAIRVLRTVEAPAPRYHHSAVRFGKFMVIYGGFDANNEPLGDVWAFDLETSTWEKLQCDEVPRAGHASCVIGSRMIVVGGFEQALDSEGAAPLATILELTLVPNAKGFHWREVPSSSPMAPAAFLTACACGDGVSFMTFGGLSVPPPPKPKETKKHPNAVTTGSTHLHASRPKSADVSHSRQVSQIDDDDDDNQLRLHPVCDQGILFTFPVMHVRKERTTADSGAVKLNHLGLAIDPTEQTPEFKAFVKRQSDFLKKREISINKAIRRTKLEEEEGCDVNLYLTPEEIESLLHVTDQACESLVAYDLKTLPGHIPERELKVFLVEDCVSLLRQARDVMKSMQTKPKENVVRSKTHRKKEGEKFEEHSAAKPFRRAVVMDLLKGTYHNQQRLIKMNKGLRTVEWPEKTHYVGFTKAIRDKLRAVVDKIKEILGKYINHRVETLMKAGEKHKDVIAQLTQIVTKIQHDKVFKKDVVDPNRESRRKVLERDAQQEQGKKQHKKKSKSHSPPGGKRSRSTSPAEEKLANVVVDVTKEDMRILGKKAAAVQSAAKDLALYCVSGMWAQTQPVAQLQPGAPQPVAAGVDPVIAGSDEARAAAAHLANDLAMTAFKFGNDCLQASIVAPAAPSAAPAATSTAAATGAALPPPPAGQMPQPTTANPTHAIFHLSSVQPLLKLKKKMDEMAIRVGRIRFNVWDKSDAAGPKQDEKAEVLYKDAHLKLLSLLQRVTSAFLTKAGTKPGRILIKHPSPNHLLTTGGANAGNQKSMSKRSASAKPHRHRSKSPPHIFASAFPVDARPAVVVGPTQPAMQTVHMTLHLPVDPIVQVFPYSVPSQASTAIPITDTRSYLVMAQPPQPAAPAAGPSRPEAILQLAPVPATAPLLTGPPPASCVALTTPSAVPSVVAQSIPDPAAPPTIPGSVVLPTTAVAAPAPLPASSASAPAASGSQLGAVPGASGVAPLQPVPLPSATSPTPNVVTIQPQQPQQQQQQVQQQAQLLPPPQQVQPQPQPQPLQHFQQGAPLPTAQPSVTFVTAVQQPLTTQFQPVQQQQQQQAAVGMPQTTGVQGQVVLYPPPPANYGQAPPSSGISGVSNITGQAVAPYVPSATISGAFNGGMRPLGVHAPIEDYFLATRPVGAQQAQGQPPAPLHSRPSSQGVGESQLLGQADAGHLGHLGGASQQHRSSEMFRGKLTKGEQAILKHREQNRHW